MHFHKPSLEIFSEGFEHSDAYTCNGKFICHGLILTLCRERSSKTRSHFLDTLLKIREDSEASHQWFWFTYNTVGQMSMKLKFITRT